jgi:hypothetical protein
MTNAARDRSGGFLTRRIRQVGAVLLGFLLLSPVLHGVPVVVTGALIASEARRSAPPAAIRARAPRADTGARLPSEARASRRAPLHQRRLPAAGFRLHAPAAPAFLAVRLRQGLRRRPRPVAGAVGRGAEPLSHATGTGAAPAHPGSAAHARPGAGRRWLRRSRWRLRCPGRRLRHPPRRLCWRARATAAPCGRTGTATAAGSPQPGIFGAGRSFGVWDGLFLWFLLDNLTRAGSVDFFRNHRDDPAIREFRAEAERQARDKPISARGSTSSTGSSARQPDAPANPDYLPPGVPPEVAIAPRDDVRTPTTGATERRGGGIGSGSCPSCWSAAAVWSCWHGGAVPRPPSEEAA